MFVYKNCVCKQMQARTAAPRMTPNLPRIAKYGGWVIYNWNALKPMCRLVRKLEIRREVQRHHSVTMKSPAEAERGGMGRMEFVKLKVFWRTTKELLHIPNTEDYKHERESSKHCLIADFNRSEIEYKAMLLIMVEPVIPGCNSWQISSLSSHWTTMMLF